MLHQQFLQCPKRIIAKIAGPVPLEPRQFDEDGFHGKIIRKLRIYASRVELRRIRILLPWNQSFG